MCSERKVKIKDYNVFTIRMTPDMMKMVEYLKDKKMINKTNIIRLAISEMYSKEKAKEKQMED